MKRHAALLMVMAASLAGCSKDTEQNIAQTPAQADVLQVDGRWITEPDGNIMTDPQPSGLSAWQGKLVTLSDGSAQPAQQRQLHIIDPASAQLLPRTEKMRLGSQVRNSCFAAYLASEPDLEALVADPLDPDVFYTVTEDATRTGALSARCQQRYKATGSTDYPTLLVRLERSADGAVIMGRVRPLQFDLKLEVGDFPNDGIEGMALGKDNILYLGLEKDTAGAARIFAIKMNDGFWETTDFAKVYNPALKLPQFTEGSHPINALEYYTRADDEHGFLLAIARNDNELWVIDTAGEQPAKRVKMDFMAPADADMENCAATERMDNASIEGVAVINDTVWMINDPWKVNYLKNIQCPVNRKRYEAMAPLLFSTPVQADWFTSQPDTSAAD